MDDILAHKRDEVQARKRELSETRLRACAQQRVMPPGFSAALTSVSIGLIAEIKRRSPSAGEIRSPFDAPGIARAYAAAGAQAISVLMDEKYFGGGEADFKAVREAVSLPLLYKEFVLDSWQIWHAASLGASAVLLIVAALPADLLHALAATCREAGIEALVEVHAESELAAALGIESALIGVNNRDLHTFQTDVETTVRLSARIPPDRVFISESGFRTADDVDRVREAGAKAVLVGETLLRQSDPAEAVRKLRRIERR